MKTSDTPPTVDSPCVQLCVLGPEGHCAGCGRTTTEIGAWMSASHDERLEIKRRAAARVRIAQATASK
ncbi:MAG: DUF1289 domain-containing protein [Planctomycetota bacterium]